MGGFRSLGGDGDNQIVYWPGFLDGRNQTLTPNPDTIYVMPFINTAETGPMVIEIPPADDGGLLNGSIMNYWQVAIEDVGPAGVDEGRGGKLLVLPPGHDGDVPEGYIPLPSDTFRCYALIRSILSGSSESAVAEAVEYGKQIKLYPLAQPTNPPETVWLSAADEVFDAAIPYDVRFFEVLDRIVQVEPFLHRDQVMINLLAGIGIERGKSFAPDPSRREVLTAAALEAHTWLDTQYEKLYDPPFVDGAHWALPARPALIGASEANFEQPDAYPIDDRGICYSFAFFSTKKMGKGQFYLFSDADADADGKPLEGAATYRLTVPADVPVSQYWSITVYDRQTHTLIRDADRASRSSQSQGLKSNNDGSTDIYFGPNAPAGKEANWIPTDAAGRFEAIFRFYGPTPALHQHTWSLPDIRRIPG